MQRQNAHVQVLLSPESPSVDAYIPGGLCNSRSTVLWETEEGSMSTLRSS